MADNDSLLGSRHSPPKEEETAESTGVLKVSSNHDDTEIAMSSARDPTDLNVTFTEEIQPQARVCSSDNRERTVDYSIYAKSIRQVLDDPELPYPMTMGVIGRLGTGKDKLLKGLLYDKFGACGVRCSELNDWFEPHWVRWVYQVGRCHLSVRGCLLGLFFTYLTVSVAISYIVVVHVDPVLEVNNNKTYSFLRKFIDASGDPATTIALWVSMSLLFILLLLALISVCVTLGSSGSSFSLSEHFYHIYLMIVLVLCDVPANIHFPDETVEFIPVCFNAWVYAATDNLWATIVQSIFHKTERLFGRWKVRIYRTLTPVLLHEHDYEIGDGSILNTPSKMSRIRKDEEKPLRCCPCPGHKEETTIVVKTSRWRRIVPYPILITLVLILFTVSCAGLIVVVIDTGTTDVDKAEEILIQSVSGSIIGITLLTQLRNIYSVLSSFCVSQSAKIGLLSRGGKSSVLTHNLGFMNEVKKEIGRTMSFIRVMEQLYCKRFRILLIIEELDECQDKKIVEIFEALKLLLNDRGNPILSIMSLDPEPVIKALGSKGGRNGFVELQKLFDMQFCMPTISQYDVSKTMSLKIQHMKGQNAARALTLMQEDQKRRNNQRVRKEKHRFLASNADVSTDRTGGWLRASQISLTSHDSEQPEVGMPSDIHLAPIREMEISERLPPATSSQPFSMRGPNKTVIYDFLTSTPTLIAIQSDDDKWNEFSQKSNTDSVFGGNLKKLKSIRKIWTKLSLRVVEQHTDILHQDFKTVTQLFYTVHLSMACWSTSLYSGLTAIESEDERQVVERLLHLTCIELTQWLILCEQWPYRMSWVIFDIATEKSGPSDKECINLKDHYMRITPKLTLMPDWEKMIQIDDHEHLFKTALENFGQMAARSAMKYMPLTFNVNRNILQRIASYMSLSETQASISLS